MASFPHDHVKKKHKDSFITVKQEHQTGDSFIALNQQHQTGNSSTVVTVKQQHQTGDSIITVKHRHRTGDSIITVKHEHQTGDSLITVKKQQHATGDSFITVKIVEMSGRVEDFRVKRHEPLQRLMMTWRDQAGFEDYRKFYFVCKGRRINVNDDSKTTANDVGLKDGDFVHVMLVQTGT
ncbi:hypothetical protein OSB04_017326 [Centaurea solstitialis]|uniref:Rad60/SUMO-like domain-containing protein n=1 Tax=Centaurea solstitialis TaxID=347529 RepID=A0AA38WLX4_9ASTR|nr:hypothetical protein OSB04_017326 [Centaurea solstitialis]